MMTPFLLRAAARPLLSDTERARDLLNSLIEGQLRADGSRTSRIGISIETRSLAHSTMKRGAFENGQVVSNSSSQCECSRAPQCVFFSFLFSTIRSRANAIELPGIVSRRICATRCINESAIHSPSAMRPDVSAIEAGARSDGRIRNRARFHSQGCDTLCCK